jgi:hypothetical protein
MSRITLLQIHRIGKAKKYPCPTRNSRGISHCFPTASPDKETYHAL